MPPIATSTEAIALASVRLDLESLRRMNPGAFKVLEVLVYKGSLPTGDANVELLENLGFLHNGMPTAIVQEVIQ